MIGITSTRPVMTDEKSERFAKSSEREGCYQATLSRVGEGQGCGNAVSGKGIPSPAALPRVDLSHTGEVRQCRTHQRLTQSYLSYPALSQ